MKDTWLQHDDNIKHAKGRTFKEVFLHVQKLYIVFLASVPSSIVHMQLIMSYFIQTHYNYTQVFQTLPHLNENRNVDHKRVKCCPVRTENTNPVDLVSATK